MWRSRKIMSLAVCHHFALWFGYLWFWPQNLFWFRKCFVSERYQRNKRINLWIKTCIMSKYSMDPMGLFLVVRSRLYLKLKIVANIGWIECLIILDLSWCRISMCIHWQYLISEIVDSLGAGAEDLCEFLLIDGGVMGLSYRSNVKRLLSSKYGTWSFSRASVWLSTPLRVIQSDGWSLWAGRIAQSPASPHRYQTQEIIPVGQKENIQEQLRSLCCPR